LRANSFDHGIRYADLALSHRGKTVDTGRWQGVPTEGKPDLQTVEVLDFQFWCPMPTGHDLMQQLVYQIKPNLPWADNHFDERVSRVPSNPGEAYKQWPWWHDQTPQSMIEGKQFSHTYQERIWPYKATPYATEPRDRGTIQGIRYRYGDLDDVVDLLLREPYTRQAYLPIFFPEDTGAVHGGRIPCTIGYQFMLRRDSLRMWYTIRSCDYIRHFRDDIYLAARLLLWVLDELRRKDHGSLWRNVLPGTFHFHSYSLHYHKGDEHHRLHKV
jgi:hypothetical protein